MSRRTRSLVDYAGAAGRMSIQDVLALGSGWGVMEKADGAYCHVYLDGRGCIERVLSRTGEPFPRSVVGDLLGCHVGAGDSVLCGEIECHTEAGNRAAEERGYRVIHLFDAIRVNGVYLAREPFRVRRDWLYRGQSWAENLGQRRHYRVEKLAGYISATAAETPSDDVPTYRARSIASGRFCRAVPRTWERTPILPLLAPAKAGEIWERAVEGQAEGVVAVRLDAKLGARRSKVKCKPLETIDAVVLQADPSGYVLRMRGSELVFATGRGGIDAQPDDVLEVAHEGWYTTGCPRFARLVRRRPDLGVAHA